MSLNDIAKRVNLDKKSKLHITGIRVKLKSLFYIIYIILDEFEYLNVSTILYSLYLYIFIYFWFYLIYVILIHRSTFYWYTDNISSRELITNQSVCLVMPSKSDLFPSIAFIFFRISSIFLCATRFSTRLLETTFSSNRMQSYNNWEWIEITRRHKRDR